MPKGEEGVMDQLTAAISSAACDEMKQMGESLLNHMGLGWDDIDELTIEYPGEFKCEMKYIPPTPTGEVTK